MTIKSAKETDKGVEFWRISGNRQDLIRVDGVGKEVLELAQPLIGVLNTIFGKEIAPDVQAIIIADDTAGHEAPWHGYYILDTRLPAGSWDDLDSKGCVRVNTRRLWYEPGELILMTSDQIKNRPRKGR